MRYNPDPHGGFLASISSRIEKMAEQNDLQPGFFTGGYPDTPGCQAADTSHAAANAVAPAAETLRPQVLAILRRHALTADEVAGRLGRSILSIRPRLSELRAKGQIADTKKRRLNESGHKAIVWSATT